MPGLAVLSDEEKTQILKFLGYPVVSPAQSIALGIPASSQPLYLALRALDFLPEHATQDLRLYLSALTDTERRIFESQERLAAQKVGEIELNPEEPELLEQEYRRWAYRLADLLGAPVNALSSRFRGASINIPVTH